MSGNPPRISFRTPSEDELRSLLSESIRFAYACIRYSAWLGDGSHYESDAREAVDFHASRIRDLISSPRFRSAIGWPELVFVLLSEIGSFHRDHFPDVLARGMAETIRMEGLIVLMWAQRLADVVGLGSAHQAERHEIMQNLPGVSNDVESLTGAGPQTEPHADRSGTVAESLNPGSRAIAAAYELQKEGRPVSVRAACVRAKVDRPNLRKNYPEAIEAIETIAEPDRQVRRGGIDARSGSLDGWDSADFG